MVLVKFPKEKPVIAAERVLPRGRTDSAFDISVVRHSNHERHERKGPAKRPERSKTSTSIAGFTRSMRGRRATRLRRAPRPRSQRPAVSGI
ncbi:protein of unknown function [Paraburkholderia kururiensis]